jgi:hypothetical protein
VSLAERQRIYWGNSPIVHPFKGRRAYCKELLSDVLERHRHLVILTGEPGIAPPQKEALGLASRLHSAPARRSYTFGNVPERWHMETMLSGYFAGLGMKNAVPGKWDDCALKADQALIGPASVTTSR